MNRSSNILIAAAIYPPDPGGPATHAKKYVEGFSGKGNQVSLAVFSRLLFLPRILRYVVYFLILLVKSVGVDVIYAQDAVSSGYPAAAVARLRKKKFIVRVGGDALWERAFLAGKTDRPMDEYYATDGYSKEKVFEMVKSVLTQANAIVVPASNLVATYEKYYGISTNKIKLIPNPVPDREQTPSGGQKEDSRTILFASRLVSYKNLDTVLDALASVYEEIAPTRFLIAGNGPEMDNLTQQAKALGLNTRVELFGRLSRAELMREMRECRATIAPALTEFDPNYVMEGLAMGKPFIVSKNHGLPFVVPAELTFDPEDKNDIAEKIKWIMSEAGYMKARLLASTLGYKKTWDDVISDNLKIIENICVS